MSEDASELDEEIKASVSPRARASKVKRTPTEAEATAPELSEETRNKLTSIMQELLLKTHELSFEYSTIDCPKLNECPLAQKSRELFKTVKELNNLVRQATPTPTPPKPQPSAKQEQQPSAE